MATEHDYIKRRLDHGTELADAMTDDQKRSVELACERVRTGESCYWHELAELTLKLAPFLAVARGIPDNWPGECVLRHDMEDDGTLCLGYYGSNVVPRGIGLTISQWRSPLHGLVIPVNPSG